MSMHIEGPWLSINGKKKGKKKWASAEQKRQAEQLDTAWQNNQKKWQAMTPKFARTSISPVSTPPSHTTTQRESPKSLNSWVVGAVSSKPNPVYTGTEVIGIAVQHKSCLQPVFNQDAARDSASMRR